MAKVDMSQFRPLKFDFGKIHLSGGQSPKSCPVTSKQITSASGECITFVNKTGDGMSYTGMVYGDGSLVGKYGQWSQIGWSMILTTFMVLNAKKDLITTSMRMAM